MWFLSFLPSLIGLRKKNYPVFNPNHIDVELKNSMWKWAPAYKAFSIHYLIWSSKSPYQADTLTMRKTKLKRLTSFYLIIWLLIGNVGTRHTNRSFAVKANVPSSFSLLWTEPPFSHSPSIPCQKKCLAEYHFTSLVNHWSSQLIRCWLRSIFTIHLLYLRGFRRQIRLGVYPQGSCNLSRQTRYTMLKQLERWCVKSYSIESKCNRFGIGKLYRKLG